MCDIFFFFFFSSRRRHTRWTGDWSSDVCSSDLVAVVGEEYPVVGRRPGQHLGIGRALRQGVPGAYQIQLRQAAAQATKNLTADRSEERRVGKECRSRWSRDDEKKK